MRRSWVVSSDGVRWSAARSNHFDPPPEVQVSITDPEDADAYGPGDEILLSAWTKGALTANNSRDRVGMRNRADRAPYLSTTPTAGWEVLPAEMYRWSSDIDGELRLDPPRPSDSQYDRCCAAAATW